MKLLVIHPGASFSTADVYTGYVSALVRQGCQVVQYNLDARIARSGRWLHWNWKAAARTNPTIIKPTPADVMYHACGEAVIRALRHRVDWIVIVTSMYFHPDHIMLMRDAGFKVGVIFTESPYDDEKQLAVARLVNGCWTNDRASVPVLQQGCPNVGYLPAAFTPDRHNPDVTIDSDVPSHDVVFVGSAFVERVRLFEAVDWEGLGIDFGLYGEWQMLGSRSRLRKFLRGGVQPNARTIQLYRRAKIGLNLYRTSIGFGRNAPQTHIGESMSPREYELSASGTFHVSQFRPEIKEVLGDLVPTFETPEELTDLLRYWLSPERATQRQAIAEQLPYVIANETFDDRASVLLADLNAYDAVMKGPSSHELVAVT